jgi:transposase-like protein
MFKKIPTKTKEEILLKIKEGATVTETAEQYGISSKTIYTWLRNQVKPDISFMEYNRLKRENDELKRIIGLITLELERGKKNQHR